MSVLAESSLIRKVYYKLTAHLRMSCFPSSYEFSPHSTHPELLTQSIILCLPLNPLLYLSCYQAHTKMQISIITILFSVATLASAAIDPADVVVRTEDTIAANSCIVGVFNRMLGADTTPEVKLTQRQLSVYWKSQLRYKSHLPVRRHCHQLSVLRKIQSITTHIKLSRLHHTSICFIVFTGLLTILYY